MPMATEAETLLDYIRNAADLILEFTERKSFPEYERDMMLRSAVERQFITIGESVSLLSKAESEVVSRISLYRGIVDFRNRLVHAFFRINDGVVWQIVIGLLPVLRAEVTELIREYERR